VTLQISNDWDLRAINSEFKDKGRIRIPNFLQQESAQTLSQVLHEVTSFENAFFMQGQNRLASDEKIAELSNIQRRELYQSIYQDAAKGVGFLYGKHAITEHSSPLLAAFLTLMNSSEIVKLVNDITNTENIKFADGQATRYRVGDFLTRHKDDPANETRKFAYVYGLSPMWHPDWGGLLQFFTGQGIPLESWLPQFNSLTIFDVSLVHSVTSIAAFAPVNRYSITGWFRT